MQVTIVSVADLAHGVVEQPDQLGRGQRQARVGPHGRPQLAHHGGRPHPAAHDVADDDRGAAHAELDDVEPVTTDLRALDAGAVVGRDLQLVGDEIALGEQAALQLGGDRVLAGGRLAIGLRRGQLRLGRALLGDVLDAAAQEARAAVLVADDLGPHPGEVPLTVGPRRVQLQVDGRAVLGRALRGGPHHVPIGGFGGVADGRERDGRFVGREAGDAQCLGAHPDRVAAQVDLEAADGGQPLGVVEQLLAALELGHEPPYPVEFEVRPDAGQQLAGRERLDQVVVGAGLQPLDGRVVARAGREHDHRDVHRGRVLAHGGEQAEAVEHRHHHVGQHEVGRRRRRCARAPRRRCRRWSPGTTRTAGCGRTRACRRCRRRRGSAARRRRPPARPRRRRPRRCHRSDSARYPAL